MLLDALPNVKLLSREEKYELASELWDEVTADPATFPAHPEMLELLEARYAEWKSNPASAVTWEDLQRKLGKL